LEGRIEVDRQGATQRQVGLRRIVYLLPRYEPHELSLEQIAFVCGHHHSVRNNRPGPEIRDLGPERQEVVDDVVEASYLTPDAADETVPLLWRLGVSHRCRKEL